MGRLRNIGRLRAGGGGSATINSLLFASGQVGLDWNFADATKVWQDSAGTVAGVSGQPVGRITDSSPNGYNGLQASAASRPVWNGGAEALLDGLDDSIKATFTSIAQPLTVFLVARQVSWTNGDYVFDGGALNSTVLQQLTPTPNVTVYAGTANVAANTGMVIGTDVVATIVFNGASSSIQIGNQTATTGNPGALGTTGFTLGSTANQTAAWANIACKRAIVRAGTVDAATTAAVKALLSARHGVAL